jgi:predicted Zn-dependent peptidase
MKSFALAVAGVVALSGAALQPALSLLPGHYPTATAVDLGTAQLFSEPDPDAALAGVQIFVSAGLDRQPTQSSGVAALVADCIVRTPVASDVAAAPDLQISARRVTESLSQAPIRLPVVVPSGFPVSEASPAPQASIEAAPVTAAPTSSTSPAPSLSASATPSAPAPAASPSVAPAPTFGLTPSSPKPARVLARPKPLPTQSVPVGMLPVRDAIAALGGTLTYTVDGRSAHFYLEGTSSQLPHLIALFAGALAKPDFSPGTLAVARASLASRVSDLEGNALSVGIQMFRRRYYETGAALPALGTAESLASLTSDDATAFYRQNYRRGALYASAVGNATSATTDALRSLAASLPDGAPAPVVGKAVSIPVSAPRIVARRDVGEPLVVIGFAAPSPGSKDFGAMLVLESLLSDAFERDSATTLSLAERSVGAFYLYDSSPASLVVYVNGGRVDPSVALREVLTVVKSLSLKPLGSSALKHFKTAAEGEFVTDSVNLSDRSYLLGTFATQGLGSDAINAALGALDRTSGADIQRVAKTYLQRYIVALVLPRSQSEGT